MFKKTVAHTHLWTCACALVHIRAIDSAIAAILLRMHIQRKPSGLVYTSARMYASKRVVSTSSCVDLKERVLTFCFPRVFRGYTEVETDKKVSIPTRPFIAGQCTAVQYALFQWIYLALQVMEDDHTSTSLGESHPYSICVVLVYEVRTH